MGCDSVPDHWMATAIKPVHWHRISQLMNLIVEFFGYILATIFYLYTEPFGIDTAEKLSNRIISCVNNGLRLYSSFTGIFEFIGHIRTSDTRRKIFMAPGIICSAFNFPSSLIAIR